MMQPIQFGQMPEVFSQQFTQPPAPKKRGMFGGKLGVGEAIVAALNGYLASQGNPVGATNMRMMFEAFQNKRKQAQDAEQYNREREDSIIDYGRKKEIDARYPGDPHYFEDNSGNLMSVGPDGRPTEVYHDPNPWKLVPNGMGGVVPVNMQELMRGQSGLPPIGSVVADPRKAGGQTAPLSGPFPDIGPYRRY